MCACHLSTTELTNMILIMISIVENTTRVATVAYAVALVLTLVHIAIVDVVVPLDAM